MGMEFIDLKSQYARLKDNLDARIHAVLDHGQYILGAEIGALEKKLAMIASTKHCVSCSSGSDALLMALMAMGVGPGDAVFVPAYTFFASAEMPALLGATPIFVDVNPVDFNMDVACLEKAMQALAARDPKIYPLPKRALEGTPLTPRVIIPVDVYGQTADYQKILPIARAAGLQVLEDGAQSFGATTEDGKPSCGLGCTMAATSFFPAKPLGCYGDGGAVFTDDDQLASELLSIRVHGKGAHKYDNRRIGINGRLDTLQAAVLLAKLDIFADEVVQRQAVAQWYAERLTGLDWLTLPTVRPGRKSVYAKYTVFVSHEKRQAFIDSLSKQGVPTNIFCPEPLHVQKAFADLGYRMEDMPGATRCAHDGISLPFHPYMTEQDVDFVCKAVRQSAV